MNGEQIIALEIEAKAAHRVYLEAAALSVSPANLEVLALKARELFDRLETELQSFEGDA